MTVYVAEYAIFVNLPAGNETIEGEPVVWVVLISGPGNERIALTLAGETEVRIKDPAVVKWLKGKIKEKGMDIKMLFWSELTEDILGRWADIKWLLRDPPTEIGKAGVEIEVPGRELWEPPDGRGLKGIIEDIRKITNK